jgi:hypothetical protein
VETKSEPGAGSALLKNKRSFHNDDMRTTTSLLSAVGVAVSTHLTAAVPSWDLAGDPVAIGRQDAARCGGSLDALLRTMHTGAWLLSCPRPSRVATWIEGLRPEHRAELDTLAASAGVAPDRVLRTNVIVEAACSAVVSLPEADQPLVVARNMDFFPAGVVGASTVIKRYRPDGQRAFISVSWPGYAGVVSGMNDAGVVACVLLRHSGSPGAGEPICFRLRRILETCGDLDAAVACFAEAPVASGHYALLADARGAVVVWYHDGALHVDQPHGRVLAVDNAARDDSGRPRGLRARHLTRLARDSVVDAARRALTTATCRWLTNSQAMVFVPAAGEVQVATGLAWRPAARRSWTTYRLTGDPSPLGRAQPLTHHSAWWRGAWSALP